MTPDPEMLKALESDPFPVLGIAKLMDALASEFLALEQDPEKKLARGPYFIEAFQAIQALSNSYSKIVQSRTSAHIVN